MGNWFCSKECEAAHNKEPNSTGSNSTTKTPNNGHNPVPAVKKGDLTIKLKVPAFVRNPSPQLLRVEPDQNLVKETQKRSFEAQENQPSSKEVGDIDDYDLLEPFDPNKDQQRYIFSLLWGFLRNLTFICSTSFTQKSDVTQVVVAVASSTTCQQQSLGSEESLMKKRKVPEAKVVFEAILITYN